jgi:hypothetical protein
MGFQENDRWLSQCRAPPAVCRDLYDRVGRVCDPWMDLHREENGVEPIQEPASVAGPRINVSETRAPRPVARPPALSLGIPRVVGNTSRNVPHHGPVFHTALAETWRARAPDGRLGGVPKRASPRLSRGCDAAAGPTRSRFARPRVDVGQIKDVLGNAPEDGGLRDRRFRCMACPSMPVGGSSSRLAVPSLSPLRLV